MSKSYRKHQDVEVTTNSEEHQRILAPAFPEGQPWFDPHQPSVPGFTWRVFNTLTRFNPTLLLSLTVAIVMISQTANSSWAKCFLLNGRYRTKTQAFIVADFSRSLLPNNDVLVGARVYWDSVSDLINKVTRNRVDEWASFNKPGTHKVSHRRNFCFGDFDL